MRTDFENIENYTRVTLYPNSANPLHKKPVQAFFSSGYFYCDGSSPADGPDYYFGDVLKFHDGFEVAA